MITIADTIKAADGGYLFNSKQFEYSKDNLGRPVLNLKGGQVSGDGSGDFKVEGTVPMTGNLYMNGSNIMGVKSISNTDSGIAIESEVSLNNHKFTDLLDPVDAQDATIKKYVVAILPAFTASDNGKVLGIVNGALVWVNKA